MKRVLIAIACLLFVAAPARPDDKVAGPVGEPTGAWREQIHWVPMQDRFGNVHLLYTRICRPQGDAPARIAVINHGSPPNAGVRPSMQPAKCDSEAVQWFLTRGFLVVLGLRRGYGATGGAWSEGYGACTAEGYVQSGLESAREIDAWVTYATALPYARPNGVVVVGQSAGGWATDAYDSVQHPKVIAMISMAGGRGGHWHNMPNNNCRPDELARAAGVFGATASTPMLWVYTANDSFFAPVIAVAMHEAFTRSGGKAELVQPGPFGKDGHALFFGKGGSAIWGPLIEWYLGSRLTSG